MSDNNNPVDEVLKIFDNDWNKQVILYGPPGTSKTYSAIIIAANMLGYSGKDYEGASEHLKTCKNFKLVQFHPSYSYEDFVRGITVKPNSDKIEYKTESKIFETFCLQKGKKVLIIDEINRAPLASVLGELIYGLEYRNKEITTPYELEDNKPLVVPDDLYIIGTMNTADRSIGSIDYAVRRRFAFVQVGSSPEEIKNSWINQEDLGEKAFDLYNRIMHKEKGLFSEDLLADPEIDVDDIKIGHTYFLGLKKEIASGEKKEEDENGYLEYRIKYQIKPIYMEYIKDGIINPNGKERFETIVDTWRAESEKPDNSKHQ